MIVDHKPPNLRPSRVLAGVRIAMIALFALWVTTGAPGHNCDIRLIAGLTVYLLFALVVLYCAWRNWWLDFHLALPSFLMDTFAFWIGLLAAQKIGFDAFSPFMTFFAFLVISAASRWNQKYVPQTAVALGLFFGLAGLLLYDIGAPVNLEKLPRRFSYLLLLALLLGWFAMSRGSSSRLPAHEQRGDMNRSRLDRALALAMAGVGAKGAAVIWSPEDEPMSKLYLAGDLGQGASQLPPDRIEEPEGLAPMLFDRTRQKRLILEPGETVTSRTGPFAAGVADYLAVSQGLSVPLNGNLGRGQLVLSGASAACWDDIWLGLALAREVSTALDDEEAVELSRALAETRIRTDVARDLHDSLAQSLAGARYRLEAMREGIDKDSDMEKEMVKVIASLRDEQEHVRQVITRLRKGNAHTAARDLGSDFVQLASSLADQWRVNVQFLAENELPLVPAPMAYGLLQITREAVANAVRHGKAKAINVRLAMPFAETIALLVVDDGQGMPDGRNAAMPRSIAERAAHLGGSLRVNSTSRGTTIELQIQLSAAA